MDTAQVKKPRKLSPGQIIIGRFIKMEAAQGDKYFWPREMKFATELIKKYSFEFLNQMREPFFPLKMNTLAWFKTPQGEAFLTSQQFTYEKKTVDVTVKKEEIVLQPDKIGEDVVVKKEPKTLKDFLKMYEQN